MNQKEKMQDIENQSKRIHERFDRIEKRICDLICENHHLKEENNKLKNENKELELEVEKLRKKQYERRMT